MKKLIISSLVLASIFTACTDDKKEQTTHEVAKTEIKKEVKAPVESKHEVKKEVKAPVEVQEKTAAQLFGACAGCHGSDASKKALGKSAVIKGWDSAKIESALNGYKNGTYGGAMKGIMKGQVSKLSSSDIKKLAAHIAKF
jgi:cytochrome c553